MNKNGIYKQCVTCIKPFYMSLSRVKRGMKYCSRECTPSIFKKGNSGVWLGKKRPNLKKTNAAKTMFKKGLKPWNKNTRGLMPIPWNKGKEWPEMQGENNPTWTGDKIGYQGLHGWMRKRVKKPDVCEFCNENKKLQLANKSFEYKRDIADWLWLCAKCHSAYDHFYGWGRAVEKFPDLRQVMSNDE